MLWPAVRASRLYTRAGEDKNVMGGENLLMRRLRFGSS